MRIPISFLLLLLVLAEIAGFILVGQAIGVAATLGLIVLGIVAGIALLRRQGVATLIRARAELDAGRPPGRQLAEGAVFAVAALLLIVPGFITDTVGLLLFMPWARGALLTRLGRRIEVHAAQRGPFRANAGGVIELDRGDYRSAPRDDSPWRRSDGGGA